MALVQVSKTDDTITRTQKHHLLPLTAGNITKTYATH